MKFKETSKFEKKTNKKLPTEKVAIYATEKDFLPARPVYYSETVYIDRTTTTTSLWQRRFLWWSRAAVVYLYVCMRERIIYI